jgi:hypothetical protein
VALAIIGLTPVKRRAGKEINVPPPATLLIVPANKEAPKRRRCWDVKICITDLNSLFLSF